MQVQAIRTPIEETRQFSLLMKHYVQGHEQVRSFYQHEPNAQGIEAALQIRRSHPVDRNLLATVLDAQYQGLPTIPAVQQNLAALRADNCFTITTAHQPNIFTGHLYFVYKILHTISLCNWLRAKCPDDQFVPVFYMGSEDADLDELGHIQLFGTKLSWQTSQQGAVGRMKVDKAMLDLVHQVEGMIGTTEAGRELSAILTQAYRLGNTIQQATLEIIHQLFGRYGVVVLIADHPQLKQKLAPIMASDLFDHLPAQVVNQTITALGEQYKIQAAPREINLFYLDEGIRNRIDQEGDMFSVLHTDIKLTEADMRQLIQEHPERLSPNVMLRGLYQEMLLPNIAFVGGGGEMAYWLELKSLFDTYQVPFPVLLLRNSFALVDQQDLRKVERMGFDWVDFFENQTTLLNQLVKKESASQIHLTQELRDAAAFYQHIEKVSATIDSSLQSHAAAIGKKSIDQIAQLEKKLLRAEKRKFSDQSRQINHIRRTYFPGDGLQERYDNLLPFYAKWGNTLLEEILRHSPPFHEGFISLILTDSD
jgi:bacillithiol biosynthesis cysteine-adding enzyme BshC